jgi:DNA-directed RNA polymerase specialized sigma24 family protein
VELEFYGTMPADELIALDNALTDLQQHDPLKAKIVTNRYFGGMTIEETASAVGKSAASVKHHWKFAKAWLYREMKKS